MAKAAESSPLLSGGNGKTALLRRRATFPTVCSWRREWRRSSAKTFAAPRNVRAEAGESEISAAAYSSGRGRSQQRSNRAKARGTP